MDGAIFALIADVIPWVQAGKGKNSAVMLVQSVLGEDHDHIVQAGGTLQFGYLLRPVRHRATLREQRPNNSSNILCESVAHLQAP